MLTSATRDFSPLAQDDSIFRINLFCIVNQPPPPSDPFSTVLSAASFILFSPHCSPRLVFKSRGLGSSLCLLFTPQSSRVSPPPARQTNYSPYIHHPPEAVSSCLPGLDIAFELLLLLQKREFADEATRFFVAYAPSSARLSCARNFSSWVAERSRLKPSRMTAIAQCR